MILPLTVAIASTTSKPGDLENNLNQITDFARRAAADGADLLLTPEMSASGYGGYPEVLKTAEIAGNGPIFELLSRTAQETGVVICAGCVEKNGEKRHIAQMAVFPDRKLVVQRKHRTTSSEAPLEPFASQLPPFGADGTGTPSQVHFEIFEVAGVRCAMVICADAGIENLDEHLRHQGVQVVLLPVGAGGQRQSYVSTAELDSEAGRQKYMAMLERVFLPGDAPAKCLEFRCSLAAVNLCGFDGQKHYHAGHGSITTAMGEVVALIPGVPHLERQRPLYAFARFDAAETLDVETQKAVSGRMRP